MDETDRTLEFGAFPETYPLDEPLVSRYEVVGFPGDHDKLIELYKAQPGSSAQGVRFLNEVTFLRKFPEIYVYCGAATNRIHPFITVPEKPLTVLPAARDVLRMLRASCFESEHITSLDVASIPFPGYHPYTKNDEIHSDPGEQSLFATERNDDSEQDYVGPEAILHSYLSRGCHEAIRSLVHRRIIS